MATSAQPYMHATAQLWAAWGVHAYTSSGAIAAFAGTLAVIAGDYRAAFLWMVAATIVDATDGVLARLARVKEMVPGFDGARLDDIVDYLTYVFLPVLLLYHAGDLPRGAAGFLTAAAVLLSSAYGFASLDAKTEDYFFTGFPSYWNIGRTLPPRCRPAAGGERRGAAAVRLAGVRPRRLRLSVTNPGPARLDAHPWHRVGAHGAGDRPGHTGRSPLAMDRLPVLSRLLLHAVICAPGCVGGRAK